MRLRHWALAGMGFWAVLGSPALAIDRHYKGFCEASAAVKLDDNRFAVASDDFDQILVFERGNPTAKSAVSLGNLTDLEGAARIGDVVYWLTSHSLNSDKEDRPRRKVAFATSIIAGGTLGPATPFARTLREDAVTALKTSEAELMTRFNIEGLADTPDGQLIVGLRGPLAPANKPGERAILFKIKNPKSFFGLETPAGPAIVDDQAIELDLSDGREGTARGIRDIARVGDRYLILAGSEPDGGNPPPRLFWWDGKSNSVTAFAPAPDFTGMTPEAILVWDDHSAEILSDDGGRKIGGVKCDDKDKVPAGAEFAAIDVRF